MLCLARGDDVGLDAQAFGIGDATELEEVDVHQERSSLFFHMPFVIR